MILKIVENKHKKKIGQVTPPCIILGPMPYLLVPILQRVYELMIENLWTFFLL